MAIIILPVCFIAIFLSLGVMLGETTGKRDIVIFSVLIFSTSIVGINELLSAFSALNFACIFISWGIIALGNVLYLYKRKQDVAGFIISIKDRRVTAYEQLTRFDKFLLYSTALILLLVFVQGIIYPPNNWDSMTYHLARITSWISRGSVGHFPTHIFYQVYQPPFAEYVVMHFNILTGSDHFAGAVQFCFFLFTLAVLSGIVKTLGLGRRYQVLAIVFAAFIPEVLLQASSTQNNVVEAFFVLTAYYLSIKALNELKLRNYIFMGVAIGLALLTKATSYIYLTPILLLFGINVLIAIFKTKNYRYLWYGLLIIPIVLAVNARQYQRNYAFSKSILGTPRSEVGVYTNKKMGPLLLLSNLLKNAGLQMNMMGSNKPAIFADTVIHQLHKMAGVEIDGFDNNFAVAKYSVPTSSANQEDGASNPFHFMLLIFAFALVAVHILKSKHNKLAAQLLFILVLQAILFCWFLKWQPWNTRMHVQFFLLSVPLFCYAVSISRLFKKITYIAMPLIMLYGFVLVLHSATKPYLIIGKQQPFITTPIFEARYKKYFVSRPYLYTEYQQVNTTIQSANYKNIGLIMGFNDWQYPLFAQCYSRELNPIHLFVDNATKDIKNPFTSVDCIISTNVNRPYIDYNSKRFYNKSGSNKYIYLYQ